MNVYVDFLIRSLQLKHFLYFTPKKIFFRLPFLGALSLQVGNELKFFLCKHTDDRSSVYIVDTLVDWRKFLLQGQTTTINNIRNSTHLHAPADLLISVRLGVIYLVELKNMPLQKDLKFVNTCLTSYPLH